MSTDSKAVELISNLMHYIDANNEIETKPDESKCNDTITGNAYTKLRATILSNKALCNELSQASIDWALSNGFTMGSQSISNAYIHAPHTLLPVLFNLSEHKTLSNMSLIFHKLIDAISRDHQFVINCMKTTAESDANFTGKMLNLFEKQISENEFNQSYQLGIFRSDYMKNSLNNKWAQIEFNTISASFGPLSDLIFRLHKFLLSRFSNINAIQMTNINNKNISKTNKSNNIFQPPMNTTNNMAYALGIAAKIVHPNNAIVLMIVQKNETNRSDQTRIEYALFNNENVKMIRRTMFDVYNNGTLDKHSKELIIDGIFTISVVYYRAGYTPMDYGKEGYEWQAREMIEFSTAIKCPSVGYHLIGSKIWQTIFNKKNVLLKYLNETEANHLLSVFVKLYSLQNNEIDENIQMILENAKENYKNYVLKPQREGGGNNYYNENIPKMINKLSAKQLEGYILMERIYPQEIDTIQVRNFESFYVKAISEMGIYSTYLSNGFDTPVIDEICGTLLRTKQAQVTEGGVATGYSVLDSVLLSNDK